MYKRQQKELFEGLKVMDLEKEWKTYPVLHFTMSGLKNLKVSEAKSKLENFIADYERLYGRNTEEETPGARFRGLIHRACEKTGERVVVILDEYDAPVMRLLYDTKQLEEMRMMLIAISTIGFTLYNKLLTCNPVGKVAIFNSLIPVIGAVSSCLCLSEPFYWKYIIAGALATAGIYVINKGK